MTTSPTLAKTVNDRAVMQIMIGALSDLDFTKGGHVVHCSNREENDLSKRNNSSILIRVEHDGMHLTAEGAEFILENLSRCMSKHDEKALRDFEHASWRAYQAERLVIDQHIVKCEEAADLVANARVFQADNSNNVVFAYNSANSTLNDAKAALTDAGYRTVLRAYHRRLEAAQTANYNTKALTAEYNTWLAANPNVAPISADEALYELWTQPHTPEVQAQMNWLNDFISRWDAAWH